MLAVHLPASARHVRFHTPDTLNFTSFGGFSCFEITDWF